MTVHLYSSPCKTLQILEKRDNQQVETEVILPLQINTENV